MSEYFFILNSAKTVAEEASENTSMFLFSGIINFELNQRPTMHAEHSFTITLFIDEDAHVIETPAVKFVL